MTRGWWIATVLILLAASVLVLPQLAALEASQHRQARVLETSGEASITLGNGNLVDTLSVLPLTLRIDSVGWEGQVLSLDLKVTGNEHEPHELYENMAVAIGFAFQETENVEQLLLRVIAEDKWLGSRRLLLAGDVRRREWTPELLLELQHAGNQPLPQNLKSGLRISESDLWRKQFIYP